VGWREACVASPKSIQFGRSSARISDKAKLKTGLTDPWLDTVFVIPAQQQIVEAMLKDSDPSKLIGNTLHSDATSKLFKHYQSFQIQIKNWVD
jgi:hypothetical protein